MTPTAPRDAFRSAIDVDGGIEALQRRLSRSGALASVDVRVENRGTATWPSIVETGPATPHVSVGIVWTRAATRERVLEQRAELPYGLRPGEQVRIRVPVDVKAAHAAGLRDGACVVSIGLVYEGVTWFADRGERTLQFPVEVYP